MMKKNLTTLVIAAAIATPMTIHAAEGKLFGYAQITTSFGDGKDGDPASGAATPNDKLTFGADRIRLGYKVKQGKTWGKLQVDFNKTDASGKTSTKLGVPEIIKDAIVGYKFANAANISAGVFKTPVGMDFNTSGKKLDIAKRSMEKGLVLERSAGLMISGRKISGFGYDAGIFNPTNRSKAAPIDGDKAYMATGDAIAYAGRVMYDMGKALHVEASYGVTGIDSADANKTMEDYKVYDIAGSYKWKTATFKAEYIAGSNVGGAKDSDETVWYLHGGYGINKMNEVVVRYYSAKSVKSGMSDTSLGNTYIGWNIYLGKKKYNSRIQLNYVLASGDKGTYSGNAAKGVTDNVFLAQYQVGF